MEALSDVRSAAGFDWARWSDEQLLKAAAVLHEAYASFDLVHRLLAEYGRRHQTDLASGYSTAVASSGPLTFQFLNVKAHP